jgi:hypothetical protein
VQPRRVGAAVGDRDADEDVVRRGLGVLGRQVEVAAVVEDAGLDQLELGLVAAPPAVPFQQPGVGELTLRVLVERLEVRMGRGGVEVPVALLDVLGVVPLRVGQDGEALLEDGVALVPAVGPPSRACRRGSWRHPKAQHRHPSPSPA